jgi:hypothetical protein
MPEEIGVDAPGSLFDKDPRDGAFSASHRLRQDQTTRRFTVVVIWGFFALKVRILGDVDSTRSVLERGSVSMKNRNFPAPTVNAGRSADAADLDDRGARADEKDSRALKDPRRRSS